MAPNLYAQTDPLIQGSDIKAFTASGSIGLSANAYTATGISNRRDPTSAQSTANLDFSALGFSSGLNLLYSTTQSDFRQRINTINFNASWNWLTVQGGDVSPNFSEYGLSGSTIRGGYIKVVPGNWHIELSGGQSKRGISNSSNEEFRNPAFQRMTMAGKLGYESDGGNHVFVSSHYSIDKKNSIDEPVSITPKENLTITTDTEFGLLEDRINIATLFTASAFTRDVNSAEVPTSSLSIPGFMTGFIQPRKSSRMSYAGRATVGLALQNFGVEVGYERIQPGFTSLGVSRIEDDQQEIRISPSAQFFDSKLAIQSNVVLGRDNLLDNRLQTQKNTTIGTNIQYQVTNMISVNANYNLLLNNFDSNFDNAAQPEGQQVALDRKQISHTLMLQPSFTFQEHERTHNISVSGSYFSFSNSYAGSQSAAANNVNSDTYSSSLSYNLSFPTGLSLNAMGNFLVNQSGYSKSKSIGSNIGASYSFFDQKMTVVLNGGLNRNISESGSGGQAQADYTTKTQQVMLNLTGNYRMTGRDSFSLTVRSRRNSVLTGGGNTFSELEASFNYQHRF